MQIRELFENAAMIVIDPALLRDVRRHMAAIGGDLEPPTDDAALQAQIEGLLQRIDSLAGIGPRMLVFRAELRPRHALAAITQLGNHWSWHADSARAYDVDNAYDAHGGRDNDLVEAVFEAEAAFAAIDWPFTIATNLQLPDEREITLKGGSSVRLWAIHLGTTEIAADRRISITDLPRILILPARPGTMPPPGQYGLSS